MTAQPRRADALRNRQAILAAARELVSERGPDIGMDEIAAAAGVAVGTLYRHFPAKKDLIEAIVADLTAAIGESLDSALTRVEDGTSSAVDEIAALLRSVVIDMRQERLFRFAVTGLAGDSLRELQQRGRVAVERLVVMAHRAGSLYPDITADDVILLLATAPADAAAEAEQLRWMTLARRALTPNPVPNSQR
ncbi:TetR/AcrR family transcriptional regulator [Nocardia sp. NBC_00508]|uniref:TetR/AcrR family transcriptional regulator n=1 Tax=Nocardia sp. NBC_00508 TaxID=2975992 RepID=UPI002E81CE21|nr:helix-turn-helix domain-containing protein [Nocardia sp. NBC_00508]WUD67757.1 TetR/AcrR family transcriptional regulator [Nocardia sp. NBC_00508]